MHFEYKNRYKKLIQDLADVLIRFIDDMPDNEKDLLKSFENGTETKSVKYSNKRIRQEPLKFD